MCGIEGIIKADAGLSLRVRDVFTQLLYIGAVRGKDGTGIMSVKDNSIDWRKAAAPVWDFFSMKGVPDYIRNLDENQFIVGHNRATSRGANIHNNAHPFHIKHICGVHNGTLQSTFDLKAPKEIDVDSEMLYYAIARDGITETAPKIQGSFSLVWYDTKAKKLNFLRNEERPMFLVWAKDPAMVVFGSELGMIEWTLKRNRIEIERFIETQPFIIYKFKEGSLKPSLQKVEAHKPSWTGGYGHWPHQQRSFNDDESSEFYEGCALPTARSPLLSLPAPKQAEVAASVAKIFPFPKAQKAEHHVPPPPSLPEGSSKQILAENYRNWLNTLSKNWKKGERLNFSIVDYGDKCQGAFIPIEGRHPRFPEDIYIKGNFHGEETDLIITRNLMSGIITQIAVLKKENKILIQLRDLTITDIPDAQWEKKSNSTPAESKPIEDSVYMGKFICSDCGRPKGPGIKPRVVREGTLETFVCPECDEVNKLQGKKPKQCAHCDVPNPERCVYFMSGECPSTKGVTLQ